MNLLATPHGHCWKPLPDPIPLSIQFPIGSLDMTPSVRFQWPQYYVLEHLIRAARSANCTMKTTNTIHGAVLSSRSYRCAALLLGVFSVSVSAQIVYVSTNDGVGAYNASNGSVIASPNPFITGGTVTGVEVAGNTLYVQTGNSGGDTIQGYNGTTAAAISGSSVTGLSRASNSGLAVSGNYIYSAYGTNIAKYDASTGALVTGSFVSGLNNVSHIAISNNILYAVSINDNNVSTYNATSGSLLNANFITGLSSPVGIAVSGNNLYVGSTGGTPHIGLYDAISGTATNATFISGFTPWGMAVSGNNLYVAKYNTFTVGLFDASTGSAINSSFITAGNYVWDVAATSAIPEPSTYAVLTGFAALGVVLLRRRKKLAS